MHQVPCGIALVGCGTVGSATALVLTRDRQELENRTGLPVALRHIVDLDFSKAEALGIDPGLFRRDFQAALDDPEVGIVIELVGGTTFAKTVIERAVGAGKHVVTANKALLAHHGAELFALARRNGVSIGFEASCGGGIPIIRALYDGLIANRIDAVYGIVNGTCNYILSSMVQNGRSYADSLAEAQKKGLAEADPFLDVSGTDSAHKLAILASLAFGRRIEFEAIPIEGIDRLELLDIEYGQELGYVIKLLAVAERYDGGISLRVRPVFISTGHPLAWVSGPFNAISVYGHLTGHTMYYGRGAGGSPTASAVVADVVSAALGNTGRAFEGLKLWLDSDTPARYRPIEQIRSRYYIRLTVRDTPGVLAQVASILQTYRISISSVLQKELPETGSDDGAVPVIITTHTTLEGAVRGALGEFEMLREVLEKPVCIPIMEEYEEAL